MSYTGIIVTFVFLNNVVLGEMLGLCPFLTASRRLATAAAFGLAMMLSMVLTALAAWAALWFVLVPLRLEVLQIFVFALAGAGLGRLLALGLRRLRPFRELAVHPPLIAFNCAVLGVALHIARSGFSAPQSLVAALAAGAGFFMAAVLLAAIRERLATEWVPEAMRGDPIALVTAGLMSMAFLALSG